MYLSSFLKIYFYLLCMSVLPEYTYVFHMHAWCSWRPEEDTEVPGPGITAVSHHTGARTEPRISVSRASAHNHRGIFQEPSV